MSKTHYFFDGAEVSINSLFSPKQSIHLLMNQVLQCQYYFYKKSPYFRQFCQCLHHYLHQLYLNFYHYLHQQFISIKIFLFLVFLLYTLLPYRFAACCNVYSVFCNDLQVQLWIFSVLSSRN